MLHYVRWRWTGIGALAGIGLAILQFASSGAQTFPWEGDGIARNIGLILGFTIGGMFLGLIVSFLLGSIIFMKERWMRDR